MGVVKKIIDKEYLFNYSTINNNSLKKLFNSDCLIFLDKKSYKIHKTGTSALIWLKILSLFLQFISAQNYTKKFVVLTSQVFD